MELHMSHTTILIADNNREFLNTISWFLEQEEYRVLVVDNREAAREVLERNVADLAIIDIRLANDRDEKDLSGLDLARTARTTTPKIIYSEFPTYEAARIALGPRINGLPPAVDFVGKDEGPQALLTAIRNGLLLNQKWAEHRTSEMDAVDGSPPPGFHVDQQHRAVTIDGESIHLTPQEFDILSYLYQRPNQVITRQQIVCDALGEEYEGALEENRVNNIIRRIRQKIERDSANPHYLQTVRGHGFKLVLDESASGLNGNTPKTNSFSA